MLLEGLFNDKVRRKISCNTYENNHQNGRWWPRNFWPQRSGLMVVALIGQGDFSWPKKWGFLTIDGSNYILVLLHV